MNKYSKLKDIVTYHNENETEVLSRYKSYLYDLYNSEGDTTNVVPEPYECYIIGRYSIDTYFKSVVKKGKGDYPTGDLMKWVRQNYNDLNEIYNSNDDHSTLLEFILRTYSIYTNI